MNNYSINDERSLNIDKWNVMLDRCANNESVVIQREPRSEYGEYRFTSHERRKTGYYNGSARTANGGRVEVLSFSKMIATTEKLWKENQNDLQKFLSDFNRYDGDVVDNELRAYISDASKLHNAVDTLQNLYQKKVDYYQAKKEQGLWGKVQWLFFTLFIDKSSRLEKLRESIPTPEKVFALAEDFFKKQLKSHIDEFEKKAPVSKEEKVVLSSIAPAVIKDSWLTKFAQDKFDQNHKVTDEAKELRNEIIQLVDYWTILEEVKDEWYHPVYEESEEENFLDNDQQENELNVD